MRPSIKKRKGGKKKDGGQYNNNMQFLKKLIIDLAMNFHTEKSIKKKQR